MTSAFRILPTQHPSEPPGRFPQPLPPHVRQDSRQHTGGSAPGDINRRQPAGSIRDGVGEGVAVGVADGEGEGLIDGVTDGVVDGVVDGVIDGVADGVTDGVTDGDGVEVGDLRGTQAKFRRRRRL